jgi:L-lactate dehydrogenase complex protein LldG
VAGAGKLSELVEAALTDARTELLDRVRSAIDGATTAAPGRFYRREGSLDPEARTQLFCERVDDYRAVVLRIDVAEIETMTESICAERDVRSLAIPPQQLTFRPAGVELVADHGLSAHELDRVDGAFTCCTAAVAETGTIILTGGPLEGRRALTLVPDLHICLVRETQICELLPEALARIESERRARRPITFISGPSATSDIELSRVEGVHGPRNLFVLVAKEAS